MIEAWRNSTTYVEVTERTKRLKARLESTQVFSKAILSQNQIQENNDFHRTVSDTWVLFVSYQHYLKVIKNLNEQTQRAVYKVILNTKPLILPVDVS